MDVRQPLGQLIHGYRHTALLYVAARLRLADLIDRDGPAGAGSLARVLAVDEDALHRVLRGLAAIQVLHEGPDGCFALTELGRGLLPGSDGASAELAILAGEEYLPAWGALLHTVRTGETAFGHVFGMDVWEHRRIHPELGKAFDASLSEQTSALAASILEAYDFSRVREVADLGGGRGGLLAALLTAHPDMQGVLFDLPQVIAGAAPIFDGLPIAGRVRLVGGDFFSAVPGGSDLYLLKSVLHDWNDDGCRAILRRCRDAMTEADRLLVIERALPEHAEDDPDTVMLDLHMLAVLGGRERRVADYRRLAGEAGLEAARMVPLRPGFQVMEFAPTRVT